MKRMRLVALFAVFMIIAAACGDSTEETTTTTADPGGGETTTTTAAPAAAGQGGELLLLQWQARASFTAARATGVACAILTPLALIAIDTVL